MHGSGRPRGSARLPGVTHWDAFAALGISLGLGLLVGLQRELAESRVAGLRTFALITLLGTLAAFVADRFGGWAIGAGLIGVAAATALGSWIAARADRERGAGITTEIAVLVMFLVGVLVGMSALDGNGQPLRTVAVAVGVAVAVLLQAKQRLHAIADRLGERDLRAILVFGAITFIVLPLLPQGEYGPYGVWNPRVLWLMVVLVVGMSLGGYIAYKFAGARAGTALAGIIGGLISSTAVTLSFSRRAGAASSGGGRGKGLRGHESACRAAALAIALASAVLYVRVLVEIGAAGRSLLPAAAWPIGAMLAAALLSAGVVFLRQRDEDGHTPAQQNPTELRSALVFAGLFAVVVLLVEYARREFGGAGVYAVAMISGVHDMDAITLSNARLAHAGELPHTTAWRAIVLATVSNMGFKTGIAGVFGGRSLLWRVAAVFAPAAITGMLFVLLW